MKVIKVSINARYMIQVITHMKKWKKQAAMVARDLIFQRKIAEKIGYGRVTNCSATDAQCPRNYIKKKQ